MMGPGAASVVPLSFEAYGLRPCGRRYLRIQYRIGKFYRVKFYRLNLLVNFTGTAAVM